MIDDSGQASYRHATESIDCASDGRHRQGHGCPPDGLVKVAGPVHAQHTTNTTEPLVYHDSLLDFVTKRCGLVGNQTRSRRRSLRIAQEFPENGIVGRGHGRHAKQKESYRDKWQLSDSWSGRCSWAEAAPKFDRHLKLVFACRCGATICTRCSADGEAYPRFDTAAQAIKKSRIVTGY